MLRQNILVIATAIVAAAALAVGIAAVSSGRSSGYVNNERSSEVSTSLAKVDKFTGNTVQTLPPQESTASTEPLKVETEPAATEAQPHETASPDAIPRGDTPSGALSGALLIGDSRTVGMVEHTDLAGADAFCATGMNVFRVLKDSANVPGIGNTTLAALLSSKTYSRIYVMLGINEIGYNLDVVENKYREVMNYLKSVQPGAELYIEANLRILKSRSDNDSIYNNTRLDEMNSRFASIAVEVAAKYIDINPLFDDGNGNLSTAYAYDDFHLKAEYYQRWIEWLSEA